MNTVNTLCKHFLIKQCTSIYLTGLLQEAQGKPFSVHPTVAAEIIHNLHEYNQGKFASCPMVTRPYGYEAMGSNQGWVIPN